MTLTGDLPAGKVDDDLHCWFLHLLSARDCEGRAQVSRAVVQSTVRGWTSLSHCQQGDLATHRTAAAIDQVSNSNLRCRAKFGLACPQLSVRRNVCFTQADWFGFHLVYLIVSRKVTDTCMNILFMFAFMKTTLHSMSSACLAWAL